MTAPRLRGRAKLVKANVIEDYEITQADPREREGRRLLAGDERGREALADVFAGTDFMQDEGKVELVLRVSSEVKDQWNRTKTAYLSIGFALLSLDDDVRLTELEKRRIKDASERIFLINESVASQLRRIALAVREQRIEQEACPSSYSTAYNLALLPDEHLKEAKNQNLVRADVTRREVMAFREMVRRRDAGPTTPMSWHLLKRDRGMLERERQRLLGRIVDIEARISEINAKMSETER